MFDYRKRSSEASELLRSVLLIITSWYSLRAGIMQALLFVSVVLLTGCIDDQKRQTSLCESEASRGYANETASLMIACMDAAGYRWDWKHGVCPVGDSSETNPYCYRPKSWAGRIGFSAEVLLQQLGLLERQA
jgi:hypothetical protein